MNKDLVHNRFAKHLKDYDGNAKIQKIMAEKLITLCSGCRYNKILEIGCGTGFLTREAVKKLDFESYTAIDIVGECGAYINEIDGRINFQTADIEEYEIAGGYDLIISNAALQWAGDFEGTVNKLRDGLNEGGELIFSTFGRENFREIFYIEGASLEYYSESELRALFPEFTVYPQEIHIMSFESPREVLRHLQKTGVNGLESRRWTKSDLAGFERAYAGLCAKRPTLTYNPVYIKYQTVG